MPRMEREGVTLGRQGFGAMRLKDGPGTDPDHDALAVVHAALDAGVRLVDTADAYQNEPLVGRAIRGRREDLTLASKFGLVARAGRRRLRGAGRSGLRAAGLRGEPGPA